SEAALADAVRERDRANEQFKVAERNKEIAQGAEEKALKKKNEAEESKAEAERQAELARVSEAQANAARDDAAREAEKYSQLLYPADINLAQQAYEANNFERASELLLARNSKAHPEQRFEWYYLSHLLHSEKEKLDAPDKGLNSLVISPDGETLAIGTGKKVELRRAAAGETKSRVNDLPDDFSIGSLAFSPDGKVLAVGEGVTPTNETVVKLYDTTDPMSPKERAP